MKNKNITSKDHLQIRIDCESNNDKAREAWKNSYKRTERERRSKFWVWFYYRMDRLKHKKKIGKWQRKKK